MEVWCQSAGDFCCMHRLTTLLDQGRSIMKKKKKKGAQTEQLRDRRGNVLYLSGFGLLATTDFCQGFPFSLIFCCRQGSAIDQIFPVT